MKRQRLYTAGATEARAPIPVAVMTPRALEVLEAASGMRLMVERDGLRVGVWVSSTDDLPQKVPEGRRRDDMVWLSRRARVLLHVDDEIGCLVDVHAPEGESFAVRPALVDDLPRVSEVDIAAGEVRRFGRWALAYSGGISIPLRLRARRTLTGEARFSRLMRTLARIDGDKHPRIRLTRYLPEKLHWRDELCGRTSLTGWGGVVVAFLRRLSRFAGWLAEIVLRRLFEAPPLAMATIEAQLGDDTNRVVRIPAEIFDILGIKAGDDVFVEWADQRVIAVAHQSFDDDERDTIAPATVDTWGMEREVSASARHLVIGVGAQLRGELRIPRRTIVNVRRRVTGIFLRRMNELTVPVGGLLLAAAAIKDFPVVYVVVGTVIVTILAMLPARYRVPPRGRWP
ncbi:MAG TPA: hypothetical protein VF618_27425 [Thermoanaerobaculia bacterium]